MTQSTPTISSWFRRRVGGWLRWALMPGIALAMIAGVWLNQSAYDSPAAYEAYHARCRSAVAAIPRQIGQWVGRETPLPQPALDLLSPNALRNVRFTDNSPAALLAPDRRVSVMIVQCKLAKDMLGHYPPRCYPAHGATLLRAEPRQWILGDAAGTLAGTVPVAGTEYEFAEPDPAGGALPVFGDDDAPFPSGRRRVVMSFLIVPGQGIVQDMDGVSRAAEDYKERHRGAAQVQVVFDPSAPLPDRAEREAIFRELLAPALPALRTLMDVSADYDDKAGRDGRGG